MTNGLPLPYPDRQMVKSTREAGRDAFGLARDLHRHIPREQFFNQHLQLQLGEARAKTTVDTVAERQMAAAVAATAIPEVAVGKNRQTGRASCRERVCQDC